MRKAVYVLHSPKLDAYKIGVTNNIEKRIKQVERLVEDEKLALIILTDQISNAYQIESELHREFEEQNVYGEWFRVEVEELVRVINSLENQFKNRVANFLPIDKLVDKGLIDNTPGLPEDVRQVEANLFIDDLENTYYITYWYAGDCYIYTTNSFKNAQIASNFNNR